MYCLDRADKPKDEFYETKERLAHHFEGSLHYRQVDVQHASEINEVVAEIAERHSRLDGLIAAAAIQNVAWAIDYPPEKISEVECHQVHDSTLD